MTDETRNRMLEKEIVRKRCRNARRKVESRYGVAQKYLSPVTKGRFLELFSSFCRSTFINANSENKIGPIFPDLPGP